MMRIRDRLQDARARKGHSIRAACREMGVDAMHISEIERGLRYLTPRAACVLAPYLGTTPLKLLHDDAADRLDRYLATGKSTIVGYIDTDDDGVPVGRALPGGEP
jgi:transcriptional regulator with XRE-family HTH domain